MASSGTNAVDSAASSISAKNSMKRARILYATNPQTAFLPATDPVILQRSIDRRKRKVIRNQIDPRQNSGNALALITGTADNGNVALRMNPVSSTSSALAIQNPGEGTSEATKKKAPMNDNPGGGILVVRLLNRKYCII